VPPKKPIFVALAGLHLDPEKLVEVEVKVASIQIAGLTPAHSGFERE